MNSGGDVSRLLAGDYANFCPKTLLSRLPEGLD